MSFHSSKGLFAKLTLWQSVHLHVLSEQQGLPEFLSMLTWAASSGEEVCPLLIGIEKS